MDARRSAWYEHSLPQRAPGRRWPGDAQAAWAVVTGVAVLVLAALLPIETVDNGRAGTQPRYSLLQVHGALVLLPAAVPLLVALLVAGALYAGRAGDRRWTLQAAWILSGALLAAAAVGFVTFLIGVFVVPTGVLLVTATALAHHAHRER
jgi:hypothetical protein